MNVVTRGQPLRRRRQHHQEQRAHEPRRRAQRDPTPQRQHPACGDQRHRQRDDRALTARAVRAVPDHVAEPLGVRQRMARSRERKRIAVRQRARGGDEAPGGEPAQRIGIDDPVRHREQHQRGDGDAAEHERAQIACGRRGRMRPSGGSFRSTRRHRRRRAPSLHARGAHSTLQHQYERASISTLRTLATPSSPSSVKYAR